MDWIYIWIGLDSHLDWIGLGVCGIRCVLRHSGEEDKLVLDSGIEFEKFVVSNDKVEG